MNFSVTCILRCLWILYSWKRSLVFDGFCRAWKTLDKWHANVRACCFELNFHSFIFSFIDDTIMCIVFRRLVAVNWELSVRKLAHGGKNRTLDLQVEMTSRSLLEYSRSGGKLSAGYTGNLQDGSPTRLWIPNSVPKPKFQRSLSMLILVLVVKELTKEFFTHLRGCECFFYFWSLWRLRSFLLHIKQYTVQINKPPGSSSSLQLVCNFF